MELNGIIYLNLKNNYECYLSFNGMLFDLEEIEKLRATILKNMQAFGESKIFIGADNNGIKIQEIT